MRCLTGFKVGSGEYLDNCFSIVKRKGEEVRLDGKPFEKIYDKRDPKSDKPLALKVYCSTERDPLTVIREQDNARELGSVSIPVTKNQKQVVVEFYFSSTTITVYSYPKGKGKDEKQKRTLKYL